MLFKFKGSHNIKMITLFRSIRHTVRRQPAELCACVRAASCPPASVVVTIVAPRLHTQLLRTYRCADVCARRVIVCGHVKIVSAAVCV